jgi:hypothetical protein
MNLVVLIIPFIVYWPTLWRGWPQVLAKGMKQWMNEYPTHRIPRWIYKFGWLTQCIFEIYLNVGFWFMFILWCLIQNVPLSTIFQLISWWSVFITTKVVTSNPVHGEAYSIEHYRYVIKFVSNLRQVGGFLKVRRFPPPIKLTTTILAEILLKVVHFDNRF